MQPLAPALAVPIGLVLLMLPGLLWLALLPAAARDAVRADERIFLTFGISTAVSAWLALLLAELGQLSLFNAAAVTFVVVAAVALRWRRRLAWPLARPASWRALWPAVLVLVLAVVLQARPGEYLFGGRDPGTYVAAMGLIGRTGGILYEDPAVRSIPEPYYDLFYRHPEKPGEYEWGRFMGFPLERPHSGRVVPEFFHLFPAFGAYFFQAAGVKGALATPPLFGVLATLAVFFALRLLLGDVPGFLAGVLLALNVLQVWFARYPVSEMVSQFLIFAGLAALLRWEQRREAAWLVWAGFSLGLSLLVRIDSVLILPPLMLWGLIRRAGGRLPGTHLAAGALPLGLLGLHAVLHGLVFARKYVFNIMSRPYWSQPAWVWLLLAAGLGVMLHLARRHGPALAARMESRAPALRGACLALVVLLATYAYFLRPWLSARAGADGNPAYVSFAVEPTDVQVMVDGRPAGTVAELSGSGLALLAGEHELALEQQGHVRHSVTVELEAGRRVELRGRLAAGSAPVEVADVFVPARGWLPKLGFKTLAAHDAQAFLRFGWFVTPLGLLLALGGLVWAIRHWRSEWLFPLLVLLTFAGFYFYKMRVWNDYFFAMRRVMPVTLPLTLGCAALALWQLAQLRGLRRVGAVVAGLALAVTFARETRPLLNHVDWRGAVRFVGDIARRFGPDDVLIFEQPRSVHLLALPLWAVHGLNVLELARFNPDPERLNALVRVWRGQGRNVYFVHTYSTDLCGLFLSRVQPHAFSSVEWERTYDRPPRRREFRALHFTVSRVVLPEELQVPPLGALDVGGSDDFQVSGFFEKEGGGERTYRWTGRCGTVFLPGLRPGAELVIDAAVGDRPPATWADVSVSLSGTPLGTFLPQAEWTSHVLPLPDPLPTGPALLRFDTRDWRPASALPASKDTRLLGLMVDRIRMRDAP